MQSRVLRACLPGNYHRTMLECWTMAEVQAKRFSLSLLPRLVGFGVLSFIIVRW